MGWSSVPEGVGEEVEVGELAAALAARVPAALPVSVAEGGTASATAADARTALGAAAAADVIAPPVSITFAAVAPDDVTEFVAFAASSRVSKITLGALGTAPTTGTIAIKNALTGGTTMLNAPTFALSGLTDNTITTMTLTGTAEDLDGTDSDGIAITVENNDSPVMATFYFAAQS